MAAYTKSELMFLLKADAFAVKLGYAKDLRPALVKLQVREDNNRNTNCYLNLYHT